MRARGPETKLTCFTHTRAHTHTHTHTHIRIYTRKVLSRKAEMLYELDERSRR